VNRQTYEEMHHTLGKKKGGKVLKKVNAANPGPGWLTMVQKKRKWASVQMNTLSQNVKKKEKGTRGRRGKKDTHKKRLSRKKKHKPHTH